MNSNKLPKVGDIYRWNRFIYEGKKESITIKITSVGDKICSCKNHVRWLEGADFTYFNGICGENFTKPDSVFKFISSGSRLLIEDTSTIFDILNEL